MIDDDIVRRAHAEIGRLNRELAAIHEDEERCILRRSRIDAQKAAVQLLIDQHNLVRRLAAQPEDKDFTVRIEKLACGANYVHVDKKPAQPAAPPTTPVPPVFPHVHGNGRNKPDGLPSVGSMILETLSDGKRARPADIADYVRRKYWPGLKVAVRQMAKAGRLAYHDGQYSLPKPVGAPLVSQNGMSVPEAAE